MPVIQSMTAFACHALTADWGVATWEIKTVNHRYLDISIRLPEALRALEMAARDQIKQNLARGKVEVSLHWQVKDEQALALTVDHAMVRALVAAGDAVTRVTDSAYSLRAADILQWPGIVNQTTLVNDHMRQDVLAGLASALQQLVVGRQQEGQQLSQLLHERVQQLLGHIALARQAQAAELIAQRARLQERFAQAQVTLDPTRLEQEMVMLANKMDIAEELDRLEIHLQQMQQMLMRGGVCGRRLDFLLQELNREANTLGAKALHVDVTQASIEIKVLIEQLREQVQNIE
jgi:uncharacterized protein (TIGR00255 family)